MYNCEPIVKIIEDAEAKNSKGETVRLTTFQLQYQRYILPELNTHRSFSRCSLSNRALPTEKLLEQVKLNPWGPKHFFKNCKGMVGMEEYSVFESNALQSVFAQIANSTALGIENALDVLKRQGIDSIHKQTINRLLEPYQSVKTVLTADNKALAHFFKLRCAPDAQPEMQELAKEMKRKYEENTNIRQLNDGDLYLPYITEEERNQGHSKDLLMRASSMRCARVSYDKLDGVHNTIEADAEACEKLISKEHFSPLEMACYVDTKVNRMDNENLISNFQFPFVQFRKIIENN